MHYKAFVAAAIGRRSDQDSPIYLATEVQNQVRIGQNRFKILATGSAVGGLEVEMIAH